MLASWIRSKSRSRKVPERFIPVCEPALLGNEKAYALEVIESGWISSAGKYVPAFEEAFASYCGVKHGIAVCNGTVALHLALTALGVGKGDEVIMPDFTMIASAFAVCYTGAIPVFVDADPETWNIDPEKIEEKITKRTKAIMPVHIYGHPCDMKPILDLASEYTLKIIEDAAEAQGAEYLGKRAGSLGDIAAFSFFANKIATTGEGGMVVTDNDSLAERCRYYKNLCFPLTGDRDYVHENIGFNYRMPNLLAALGLAQVEKLSTYVEMRRHNHSLYAKHLVGVPGVTLQLEKEWAKNVYWMNGIVVDRQEFGISRDELMDELKLRGVETRKFFTGMHRQPSLRKYGCDCSAAYPVSVRLSGNALYLPSGSGLCEEDIMFVCETIKEAQLRAKAL
jgi:perosamine synthetase